MADATAIEWTESTWNPVTGCSKTSPGCRHCYAERMALRLQGMGQANYARGFEVAGTVRNLPDGRVELVMEGDRAELEAFQQAIRDSEVGYFIRQEEARWTEAKNEFRGFEIVR